MSASFSGILINCNYSRKVAKLPNGSGQVTRFTALGYPIANSKYWGIKSTNHNSLLWQNNSNSFSLSLLYRWRPPVQTSPYTHLHSKGQGKMRRRLLRGKPFGQSLANGKNTNSSFCPEGAPSNQKCLQSSGNEE